MNRRLFSLSARNPSIPHTEDGAFSLPPAATDHVSNPRESLDVFDRFKAKDRPSDSSQRGKIDSPLDELDCGVILDMLDVDPQPETKG